MFDFRRISAGKHFPILGDCKNFTLEVASKKTYIFLSGFSPSVSEEDIKNYISTNTGATCKRFKMKTKNSKYKSSFKIEVLESLVDKIMTPNLWGEGVVINNFIHARRSPEMRVNPNRQR